RLPFAPLVAATTLEDRRREHRALGGPALPHPLAPDRRPGRLPDRRRPDRGARTYVTRNVPFMPTAAWMSHWYVYLPFLSLTVQVFVPTAPTLVFLFTPGPKRWKLWALDLSLTTILYVPCFSFFTSFLALVTSMS